MFGIEQAHWVLLRTPPPGRYQRPLLAHFLYFKDKEILLQRAQNMPGLLYNNNIVSIFPDFSAATQKQHAAFQNSKQLLRDRSFPYSMMYPARLRVVYKAKVQFFTQRCQQVAGVNGEYLTLTFSTTSLFFSRDREFSSLSLIANCSVY